MIASTLCAYQDLLRGHRPGGIYQSTRENLALQISQPPSAQGEFGVYEDRTAPIFLVRVVAVVDNQSGGVATLL